MEETIVQDADRLDALGAIGIARTFAYGGKVKRPIYDPEVKPIDIKTKQQYISNNGTSINHFYEKLLLIPEKLNTDEAKSLAKERVNFINNFLQQFYCEWNMVAQQ